MKIAVVGSINTDITLRVAEFPRRNETIIGRGDYLISQGGKGANQAAAAAATGAEVLMVGCVGSDDFGTRALEDLKTLGVDCSAVRRSAEHATGLAAIHLDRHGDNFITVAPGANAALSARDIEVAAPLIAGCDVVMLQLEIPWPAINATLRIAVEAGVRVLLDPAPAPQGPLECLADVDLLTPNEVEAEALTGIAPDDDSRARACAQRLLEQGARTVVLTLGGRGCLLVDRSGYSERLEAYPVDVVDTTGAGDVFSGFLAGALARGMDVPEAVRVAVAASAVAVTRSGARSSLPGWQEVTAFRNIRQSSADHRA